MKKESFYHESCYFCRKVGKEGDYSLLQETLNHQCLKTCETCQSNSPSTNSVEILHQITIDCSNSGQNDVPERLCLEFEGELLQETCDFRGHFLLQERLINRYPYWKHMKENYLIWYNHVDEHWSIGHSKDIGTSTWIFAGERHNHAMTERNLN